MEKTIRILHEFSLSLCYTSDVYVPRSANHPNFQVVNCNLTVCAWILKQRRAHTKKKLKTKCCKKSSKNAIHRHDTTQHKHIEAQQRFHIFHTQINVLFKGVELSGSEPFCRFLPIPLANRNILEWNCCRIFFATNYFCGSKWKVQCPKKKTSGKKQEKPTTQSSSAIAETHTKFHQYYTLNSRQIQCSSNIICRDPTIKGKIMFWKTV